ncbi:MAG: hypothetical protein EX266_11695 [Rhodobacteraceae bacterium]|nr:MAG: hypothetical protein EX266_11695 [Paracoccaceae bacterium]
MPGKSGPPDRFDILIVGQKGRLTYEAVLFAASLRHCAPDFAGRLIVAEPQPGPLWPDDPKIDDAAARDLLTDRLGAEIRPFESRHFGAAYPYGNKIEALLALEPDRPFVFFDTDTLITGPVDALPFDFDRPSASMAREATWPEPQLYGPGYDAIWRAIYARFDVPFEPTLDPSQPDEHWERYLYFNAGWFFHRCPQVFGRRMIEIMTGLQDGTMPELASQSLDPWLDQAALPVAIASLGGGRPTATLAGLDGDVSCHWRAMPLYFARASDEDISRLQEIAAPNRIKKVLKTHEPFRRMIYQGRGAKVRALFDRANLPPTEKAIRNRIKRERLWMR